MFIICNPLSLLNHKHFHFTDSKVFISCEKRGIILLAFSVTPSKIDQNKKSKPFNRLSPESGNRKKVDMPRPSPRFRSQQFLMEDMRRNVFPKFIEICMETPCWCPPRWAPTWWPETNRNICHWVLLQKREFISRRTHKRNNNSLF